MDANRVTQQLRRDTETLEARQARLQQMAASTQTSRKWPNVHYRYTPEATQARLEQHRKRHTDVNPDMPLFEQ